LSAVLAAAVLSAFHESPAVVEHPASPGPAAPSTAASPDATASLESRIAQLRKQYPPREQPSDPSAVVAPRSTAKDEPILARGVPTPARIGAPSAKPEGRPPREASIPPPPAVEPAQPVSSLPDLPSRAEGAVSPPRPPGLAGLWRYSQPDRTSQRPGLYAADRVEVGVSEESGVLYGYYTAHYIVPGGGISPDVSFRFSGPSGQDAATGTWSGTNGNRGEIRLRAVSGNALEVVWVTTHVERANSLASGKVTLQRAN